MATQDPALSSSSSMDDDSSKNRPKKFRNAWLMFDIFKDWLRPHPSPILAVCIVCKRVIRAGKSELEKHAEGKKHVKNLRLHALNRGLVDNERELMESVDFNLLDRPSAISNYEDETIEAMSGSNNCPKACCRVKPEPIVTKRAPKWSGTGVFNGLTKQLKSDDYTGKYLVFLFYPRDFQSVSAGEINRLSDQLSLFKSINTELVACSTDSHLSHLAWAKMKRPQGGVQGVRFPLLSDPTRVIANDYGVYMPEKGHSLSACFIIDCEGILRHTSIYDPMVGRGTKELLRLVKSCQHSLASEDFTDVDWVSVVKSDA